MVECGRCGRCGWPIYRATMWRFKRTSLPVAVSVKELIDPSEVTYERDQYYEYRATRDGEAITTCPNCWGNIVVP